MAVDVGSAIAYLDLDTSKFKKGLSSALVNLQEFTDSSLSVASRVNALGDSFTSVGSSLTKSVTLPLVGVGTAATKVAADFDTSMSKVEAISGATGDEVSKLRDKAIEMGAKTKFSAKESADAFTYMAMAGWDAKQMMDGIAGIMSLAAADGLDLATTSDIVTDALTAFGLQAKDSSHFADVLAQASSSANTNVSLLGESFKYVAPVAGALGMSAEDTAMALGLMANSGIKGSMAGTALRTSLTNLVKPSDAMAAKMEELGIEVTNTDGTMKSLREIMDMLREKFGNLSEAEQANAAATIFGKEAMSGMLAIINTSQADYDKLANSIDNANGRADAMADTMMNNLNGSITLLKSAIESLLIKLGEALIPTIKKITEFITRLVEKLNTMSDAQAQQIVKIAAIAAAIGPLLLIVGKIITSIATIITAIQSIVKVGGVLIGGIKTIAAFISSTLIPAIASIGAPVLIVIGVIVALVAAGVALYKNWETVSAFASKVWNGMKDVVSSAIEGITSALKEFGESVSNFFSSLGEKIKAAASALSEGAKAVLSRISDFFSNVKDVVVGWWKSLAEKWGSIVDSVKNALHALGDMLSELGTMLKDMFGKIASAVAEFGSMLIGKVVEIGKKFVEGFSNAISTLASSVSKFLAEAFATVVVWGSNLWNKATEIGKGFVEILSSSVKKVGQFFSDIFDGIVKMFTEFLPKMVEIGGNIIKSLWKGMESVFKAVASWITDTLSSLFKPITDFFDKLFGPIKKTFDKVTSFVSGSHANGLDYVPYDGYVAELHKGERVLTKAENEEYNNSEKGGNGNGDTFNFYNTKPDPYEYARQMKRVKKELAMS